MNKSILALLCSAYCAGIAMQPSHAAVNLSVHAGANQQVNPELNQQVNVTVTLLEGQPATNLSFAGPVRLEQLLNAVMTESEAGIDSLQSNLRLVYRNGNSELQATQQALANDYDQLAAYWQQRGHSEFAQVAASLAAQVRGLRLAYQPYAQLDVNQARFSLADNPLLPAGEYMLLVDDAARTNVLVFGVTGLTEPAAEHLSLTSPLMLPLEAGLSVRNYVTAIPTPERVGQRPLRYQARALLNTDTVALVRRNTELNHNNNVHVVPVGSYNADGRELQPGDMLWLGGDNAMYPREFKHLQTQVPELLVHYVPDANQSQLQPQHAPRVTGSVPYWESMSRAPRRNHYGGVGLMQTPTARMADEGETILMYADTDEYRRYTVSMQVLPWLQASAFYTRIPNRLYSSRPDFSGSNIYTDKGFDVKFRLWQERQWLPEVALGFSDFAGTGFFDGEYLVASKRWGAFDFSLGLGFGRHGTRDHFTNPMCEVSDRFCERPVEFSGTGSQLEFDRYFRGPAALFGGVEYQTPWEPLRLMLEYDGNDYSRDRAGIPIDGSTPWNIGASYRVTDWLDTSVSYERGDTLMFNVVLRTNLNTLRQVRVEPKPLQPEPPAAETTEADADWDEVLLDLYRQQGVSGVQLHMPDEQTVRVTAHPWRYRDHHEGLDRSARVLADHLPESINTYEFETQSVYQSVVLDQLDADAFKRRVNNEEPGRDVDDTRDLFVRSAPEFGYEPDEWIFKAEHKPRIGYGFKPFFNQDFGSPETFHFYQLGVNAFASSWITQNLQVFGELGINIKNNYHKFNFERDPFDLPLPRVRTDFRQHATNDVWIDRLQLTYYDRLSENVYGMAYGGYLERFFAGVGGELLYREVDSPWAFGVNINRVRQRNYEGWLGFESYETTTGHASVYYQMPWLKDSLLRLDFGRFLAGDTGVGVDFSRRFDSGVIVSAYASFTNVSSDEYGEGSFTHGFSVSIPFDLIGVRPTRQRIGVSWSPMSRDGGQPLWRRTGLYGVTDERMPFWGR